MKRSLILMTIILFALQANFAINLPGFLGLAWGEGEQQARALFQTKSGLKLVESPITPQIEVQSFLAFKGEFAGQESEIMLAFINDHFYQAVVVFDCSSAESITVYENLKKNLIQKYGDPTKSIEEFKSPYKMGDGNELLSILGNSGKVDTWWAVENNVIDLQVEAKNAIAIAPVLTYANSKMYAAVQQLIEEKNQQDY